MNKEKDGHGEHDPHVWLDPINAKVIIKEITNQLVQLDSKNSSIYKSNSKKALTDIDKLVNKMPVSTKKVLIHLRYFFINSIFNLLITC